jgi:quercetin dioxygenase-like cupin family protein
MTIARSAAVAVLLVSPFVAPATAEESGQYQNLLTPLFEGNETIIGQEIAYPRGTPNVTAAIVTIPPGRDTGWHEHSVPLFVYVLEGEISVDYGDKGVKVYRAGDSLLEAMNWAHNGTNKTDAPVRIMAVYIGAKDKPNAVPVEAPK